MKPSLASCGIRSVVPPLAVGSADRSKVNSCTELGVHVEPSKPAPELPAPMYLAQLGPRSCAPEGSVKLMPKVSLGETSPQALSRMRIVASVMHGGRLVKL